jgi:hypothetical protein
MSKRHTGVKRPRDDDPPAAATEAVVDPLVARGRVLLGLIRVDNDRWRLHCLSGPIRTFLGPCDRQMLSSALTEFCRQEHEDVAASVACVLAALRAHDFDWNAHDMVYSLASWSQTIFADLFPAHTRQDDILRQFVLQLTPDDIDWTAVCYRNAHKNDETYFQFLMEQSPTDETVCCAFIHRAPVACFTGTDSYTAIEWLIKWAVKNSDGVAMILEALFLRSVASGLAFDVNGHAKCETLYDAVNAQCVGKDTTHPVWHVLDTIRLGHATTLQVSKLMTIEMATSVQNAVPELIPDLATLVASYTAPIGSLSRRTMPVTS